MADITSPEIQKYSTLVKLQPENPEAHFGLGLAHEEANNTAEAVKAYEKAIKLDSRHSRSYLHRGFHFAKGGELDHALGDWSRAFDYDHNLTIKFSRDPETQIRYQQKIDSALQQFQRPIMVNPKNSFAHYQLGTAQKYFNRLELAVQSLKMALDLNPKLWEAYHQCGEIYARLDQNKLAINNYKKAIDANPKYADTHFQIAQVYERENMSGLAVKHLEEAIRLDPEQGRYYFAFGRVYMRQTKFKNAMQQFQRALDKDPKNPLVHLHLAECCKELYRPDLALHCYEKAVELDPTSVKAVSDLGAIALQMGEVDKAIASFNRAIELQPGDPYVHYNLAQTYQRKGDNRNAETHFAMAFEYNPKDAFAAYNLGVVREELANIQGAVAAYKKAVELKPQDSQYQLRLAKACLSINSHTDAVAALRAANRQNPNDLETNFLLADAVMKSGQFDEAIGMYRKVTELNPESVDAHFHLADAFTRLEMFDYAFESLQQSLRLNSKHVGSLHALGRLYLKHRNKPSIAVDFFQQALELDPTNALAIASLGEAYVALNQPERALQFFERKLEENRENPDFLAKYAEALALGGQAPKAISELRRALQLAPENTLIRKTLGRLYLNDGKYADSLEHWQQLVVSDPKSADYKFNMARCLEEMQQTEPAKVLYNEVLMLRPDHREALQRLESLFGGTLPADFALPKAAPEPTVVSTPAVAVPTTTPVATAPSLPSAAPAPVDDLESLLHMTESLPTPAASIPAPSAPASATPAPPVDMSADDLLMSLMGGASEDAVPPPMPPAPSMPAPPSVEMPPPPSQDDFDSLAVAAPPIPVPVAEETPVPPVAAAAQDDSLEDLWNQAVQAASDTPAAPAVPAAPASEDNADINDFLKGLGYEESSASPAPAPSAPVQEAPVAPPEPPAVEEVVAAAVPEPPVESETAPPTPAEPASSIDITGLLQKAVLAQVMGNPDETESCYQQILQANPMHHQTYLLYGQFSRTVRNDNNKAVALFTGGLQFAGMNGDSVAVKQFEQELALLRSGEIPAVPQEIPTPPPSLPQAPPEAEVPDSLTQAQEAYQAGDQEKAKSIASDLLLASPANDAARDLLLGLSVATTQEHIVWLREGTSHNPKYWPVLVDYLAQQKDVVLLDEMCEQWKNQAQEQASQHLALALPLAAADLQASKDFESAYRVLSTLKKQAGQGDEAASSLLVAWSESLEESEQFEQAIAIWGSPSALFPELQSKSEEESVRIFGAWAENLEHKGDITGAISVYQKMLLAHPGNAAATGELARLANKELEVLVASGDYEKAVSLLEESGPKERLVEVYLNWGRALAEVPDYANATAVFGKGLRSTSDPQLQEALVTSHTAWATHFENEGDYEQAIEALQKYTKTYQHSDPIEIKIVHYYQEWARLLREENHTDAAADVEARFYAEYPQHAKSDPFGQAASALVASGDWSGLAALADETLASDPNHSSAVAFRAQATQNLWQAALSSKDFAAAESLHNNLTPAEKCQTYASWSEHLRGEGEFETALSQIDKWKALNHDSSKAYQSYADVQLEWGRALLEAAMADHAKGLFEAVLAQQADFEGKAAATQQALEGLSKCNFLAATAAESTEGAAAALVLYQAILAQNADHAESKAAVERITASMQADEAAAAEAARKAEEEAAAAEAAHKAEEEAAAAEAARKAEEEAAAAEAARKAEEEAAAAEAARKAEEEAARKAEEAAAAEAARKAEEAAAADTANAAEKDPQMVSAKAEIDAGNITAGEAILRERLLENPNSVDYHQFVSNCYLKISGGKRLVEFYRDLQKTCPNEPQMLRFLAKAYCDTGKDTLAVVQYRKLTQVQPSADSFAELSEAYVRLKKYGEAIKYVDNGLELDPNNARCLICKGRALFHEDKASLEGFLEQVLASDAEAAAKEWATNVKSAGMSEESVGNA